VRRFPSRAKARERKKERKKEKDAFLGLLVEILGAEAARRGCKKRVQEAWQLGRGSLAVCIAVPQSFLGVSNFGVFLSTSARAFGLLPACRTPLRSLQKRWSGNFDVRSS
jgi:hypothetical protein